MIESWQPIEFFPGYSVSDHGRIRTDKSERILALSENQFGLVHVGLMRKGMQYHRSVPLLVAKAFIPQPSGPFDTPINLDGNRYNNHVANLVWRPRWFAVKYNQQFKYPHEYTIEQLIEDLDSGEISANSFECAKRYGLLEKDLIFSIMNHTYVWPTYQRFRILED